MDRRPDKIHHALVELAQPDGPNNLDTVLAPLVGAHQSRYLAMVDQHRLTLALVNAVEQDGGDLDTDVRKHLALAAADDRATRLRVLRARRSAAEALTGLTWVALKGETIAEAMTRPGLRAFNDLDILVHHSDMAAAAVALMESGFTEADQNWTAYLKHYVGEVPFTGYGATVDLHWQLVGLGRARLSLRFDVAAMLERRTTLVSQGDVIPTLGTEDQLLHVATHCALGGARRLDQLRDIAVLAAGGADAPDWDDVRRRADSWGLRSLVGHALDRSARVLKYELPPAASSLVCGRHISGRRLIDRVIGRRRIVVAAARDSRQATVRALTHAAGDSLYSRLTGAGRWDFSNPAGRLHQKADGSEKANGADQSRHRYYEQVSRKG